jgi:hypothetical protein
MIQDAHSRKKSIAVSVPIGTTIVVDAVPGAWIYIHELIGDLTADGTVDVYCGPVLEAHFALDKGQGLTEQDEPGEDNRPRFECKPGDSFKLVVTGGTFNGSVHYSLRY